MHFRLDKVKVKKLLPSEQLDFFELKLDRGMELTPEEDALYEKLSIKAERFNELRDKDDKGTPLTKAELKELDKLDDYFDEDAGYVYNEMKLSTGKKETEVRTQQKEYYQKIMKKLRKKKK